MSGDQVLTSSWCTNWGAYNTPRLWGMVANEDDATGRSQVSAWRTLAGSVRSQRAALLSARADLVAAWPPEDNESAAAFVTELDILIKRLDTASADADTTASGLDNILNAIQTAKTTIQPLWEKYQDKHNDIVPSWWDDAEDEIDEKARTAMITAERAVEDAVVQLKVPEQYELVISNENNDLTYPSNPNNGGGNGSKITGSGRGIEAVVPHDPVPPLPGQDPTIPDNGGAGGGDDNPGDGSGGGSGGGSAVGGGGTGISTPTGSSGGGGGGTGGGPDLAGVINPGQPPIVPGESIGLPGGGNAGLPTTGGGGGGNPLLPGLLPTGGGGPITPGASRLPRGAGSSGAPRPSSAARPSGSVIGESETGRGGAGNPSGRAGNPSGRAGNPSGRAGNPSGAPGGVGGGARGGAGGVGGGARGRAGGGVRGRAGRVEGTEGARGGSSSSRVPRPSWLPEDEAGPNRRAGAAANPAGMAGAPGRNNRRARGDDSQGFDPDNPWAVAEGVDPVILPPDDDPRNDPGPNVIGRRG
ncbi:hypothetical protein [Actinoplanes sp. NPDC026619]|uniref:hypothetical protein n=1 Tax=Actinoplanes sp. NPDC026619 TaxID=3155798 RepID=UPI0033F06F1C